MNFTVKLCAALFLFYVSIPAWSACTRTGVSRAEDNRTALIPFGKINLTDSYFRPPGSLLESVVVPPTNYTYGGATGSSVLWECDIGDLSNIYFLVATNGDDRIGGYFDVGGADGLSDVYATWFAYVGLRQAMSGITLTRFWKKVPITTYATYGTKIRIRLQDIPPLHAELYRISTLPPTSGSNSAYCGANNTNGSGIGYASAAGRNYSCNQPNAYIQLSGESSVSFSFAHDKVGEDSATRYTFWGANNGFGYGMRNANRLYSAPTCVARSATPYVMLPTVSVASLNAGGESRASFTVRIECSDTVSSGQNDRQTALGFQVSEGAYNAATALGLVNSNGGVSNLLSDNYFAPNIAKGVGITVANSAEPDTAMFFVGHPGQVPLTAAGNDTGWYPVLKGATREGASVAGYSWYSYNFIATLKKINGQTVTAGKVHSTAYVLVKMQ